MTDLPLHAESLPAQLGATARLDGGELVVELDPHPAVLHHGIVRTSVLAYLVDCVAGIPLDRDPEAWTLTTDMTVRTRPVAASCRVTARFRPLREGRRSATGAVDLHTADGEVLGTGAIGFTRVPRRPDDPPKISFTAEQAVARFAELPVVDRPLREAAGIEVVDGAAGVVEVAVTDALRNPAGTMQGAMVALVAEIAAEEALAAQTGGPVVVTDLDLRYLGRTGAGPVRTVTQVVGDEPGAPAVVELVDRSTGAVITLAHARAVPVA